MLTQLSVSPSCVLQTVPPHTDPDRPCHYNLSHILFYVWRCTGILYPTHIAVGCESGAKHEWGWGWKAGMGEGQKRRKLQTLVTTKFHLKV